MRRPLPRARQAASAKSEAIPSWRAVSVNRSDPPRRIHHFFFNMNELAQLFAGCQVFLQRLFPEPSSRDIAPDVPLRSLPFHRAAVRCRTPRKGVLSLRMPVERSNGNRLFDHEPTTANGLDNDPMARTGGTAVHRRRTGIRLEGAHGFVLFLKGIRR